MNRKRSRLENMFPVEVHRADEERNNSVEVVREVHEPEPQENTPRQAMGMSIGEAKSSFPFRTFFFEIHLYLVLFCL